jgi:hypothetical protein
MDAPGDVQVVGRAIGLLDAKLTLTPGSGNDLNGLPIGPTADLKVREVARV